MTFATVEEAAKAAAMLRRFGVYAAEPRKGDDGRWKIDPGVDQAYLWDWEQVADYLLARQDAPREDHADKTDRRAGQLAIFRTHLRSARNQLGWGRDATDREIIASLLDGLEALLEVLA